MTTAVVVGGGMAGGFAAWFLARAGVAVTLVERDAIGAHASGNNPGGLNPLFGYGIPGPLQALALESFRMQLASWPEISSDAEKAFGGQLKRRLNLAFDDADLVSLAAMAQTYAETPGFGAEWLEPHEVLALEPRVDPSVLRGLWTEGDAHVDAAAYTRAVVQAAQDLGARVVTAEAQGIERRGDSATAVVTSSGTLDCDGAVIASGAWCAEPARWLGVALPVEPVKGEMLLVELEGGTVETDLAWRDALVYQAEDSTVWLGGTEDHVGFDESTSGSARVSILDKVGRALPAVRDATVLRQMAGLRPVSPDRMPIVGLAEGWDNVALTLAGGRKGMLLSAAAGRAAADLLVDGKTDLPIEPCSPARFAEVR